MRRIMLLVTVWMVMVTMMVVLAMPVIAKNVGRGDQGPPVFSGFGKPGTASSVQHTDNGACVRHGGSTQPEDKTGGGC